VEEPHATYAENAAAKADAFTRASGLLSLADDSGIEVADADRLVEAVGDATDRRARMVCALALGIPSAGAPEVEVFTGVMEGAVAPARRGEGGFGYDPVFLVEGGVTTAELPEPEKDRVSHRGRAVAAATPRLLELLVED
jgi:XTP/dITP diphosphohydrolase